MFIIVLALFVSCEKNEPFEQFDDEKLLELAYDNNYHYPEGFYHEINLTGSPYYENTVSISPINNRDTKWIELHTMNKGEARNWSNVSNENRSVNRTITQENEIDKYFEFVRVNVVNEHDVLFSRVHKSDYFIPLFDKSNFFYHFENKPIGTYNGNMSLNKTKEFIEYLWVNGLLMSDKVLVSKISADGDKYEHYIQSLTITYGDWDLYDMIYVYDNKFSLDKNTKVLTLVERKVVREIQGNYNRVYIN
jgi:hypothetical protein